MNYRQLGLNCIAACLLLGGEPALAAAPLTGGPIIGKNHKQVAQILEKEGWVYNDNKSDHKFEFGDSFYLFENRSLHMDLLIEYNKKGLVTGGEVIPDMDDQSELFINRNMSKIIRWFSGAKKPRVEKKRSFGNWSSIKVH